MAKKKKKAKKKSAKRHSPAIAKKSGLSSGISLSSLEREIKRLTHMLQTIRQKSHLVRRSLAYLEREQKKVMRQINQAKRFLLKLKNRCIQAWNKFPENAEDLYFQLKLEFNRLSERLRG